MITVTGISWVELHDMVIPLYRRGREKRDLSKMSVLKVNYCSNPTVDLSANYKDSLQVSLLGPLELGLARLSYITCIGEEGKT